MSLYNFKQFFCLTAHFTIILICWFLIVDIISTWTGKGSCRPPPMTMEPNQEFRWSLSIVRKLFKLVSQDFSRANNRKKFGFYAICTGWLFTMFCYLSTVLDDQFEMSIRSSCASVLFATIQVNNFLINYENEFIK